MTAVETIKTVVTKLSPQERRELLDWLEQQEEEAWDRQIADDFDAGKLDQLIDRARQEAREGKLRDLP